MAQDDVWHGRMIYDVNGVSCVNSWYFQELDTISDNNLAAMVAGLGALILPDYQFYWTQNVSATAFQANRITGVTTPTLSANLTGVGLVTGNTLPSTTCVVLRHYSNPPGPRTRGRMFCAGMIDSDEEEGRIVGVGALRFAGVVDRLKNADQETGVGRVAMGHWSPAAESFSTIEKVVIRPNLTVLASRQLSI